MGCVASKLDINDVHPNLFSVLNVDEMGTKLSPGQLEITETTLVLYQKGKDPIQWPFKSLRRYGFEADIFSFESGRRCPTGAGIYAFKCRRAENLFNLLQSRIRSREPGSIDVGRSDSSPPSGLLEGVAGGRGGETTPPEETAPNGGRWLLTSSSSVVDTNTSLVLPLTGSAAPSAAPSPATHQPTAALGSSVAAAHRDSIIPEEPSPLYVNCDLAVSRRAAPPPFHNPATLPPLRVPPLHPDPFSPDSPSHQYENVGPDHVTSPGHFSKRSAFPLPPKPSYSRQESSYSLLGPSSPPPLLSSPPPPLTPPSAILATPDGPPSPLNYIVLDLDHPEEGQQANGQGVRVGGVGYATIDFNKTVALINSTNSRFVEEEEPGVRKTRHNSSIAAADRKLNSPTD